MVRHWRIEMLGGLRVVLQTAFPAASASEPAASSPTPSSGLTTVERFATAKCAALLAFLALHPRRAYSREEVIALLWPDAEWEKGQTSLRSALAALRRQLEPSGTPPQSFFLVTRQTLRLNPEAFSTDVADFEAAYRRGDFARCRELYRGDLLPNQYHDWVIAARERLSVLWESVPPAPVPKTAGAVASFATKEAASTPLSPSANKTPQSDLAVRLPLALGRCFGREADVSRISELLLGTGKTPPRRLVTLTGPGGTGKTRLALEAARVRLATAFGQSVFWASLADLTNPAQIGSRIASEALQLPPSVAASTASFSDAGPLETAIAHLSTQPTALLVLDNLEQLTHNSQTAVVIETLLRRVPQLSLLLTSRHRLFVDGEWEYPVAPLSLPKIVPPQSSSSAAAFSEGDDDVEVVGQSAAIQLFVDRAQAARPDFALTPRNAPTLIELCRRLDGLPLALELVAARAHTLTPAQMLDGLSAQSGAEAFVNPRNPEARHRSLHDAIAWSLRLLPPALRDVWAALSVFRGGFSAEGAEQVLQKAGVVAAGDEAITDALTRLRERSLLTLREATGGAYLRFDFLETLREFAGEVAKKDGQAWNALALCHARYFADIAETTLPALLRENVKRHLDDLETERANLNAALDWCETQPGVEAEQIGLRLCAALWRFWEMRGPISEGRAHLSACLALSETVTEARANALNGAGMLAARQGDYETARQYHEECLRSFQMLRNTRGEAVAVGNLGLIAAEQNRYDEARALYEKSLLLRRDMNDTFGIALMLNNLGNLVDELGDPHLAQLYLEECLVLHRQRDDKAGIAQALGNLGNAHYRAQNANKAIALHEEGLALLTEINDKRGMACALLNLSEMFQGQADTKQAREKLKLCLPLARDLGDKRMLAFALDSVAHLARTKKQPKVAALLHGAAAQLREQTGVHIPPVQQDDYAAALTGLRAELGESAYNKAFEKGRALSDEAIKNAMELLT